MAIKFESESVINNLNAEISKLKKKSIGALVKSASLIKARAVVKTPVDTGFLRSSSYINLTNDLSNPSIEIGYIASYATSVHEDLEANRVTGEAKFLSKAVDESVDEVIEIMHETLKL